MGIGILPLVSAGQGAIIDIAAIEKTSPKVGILAEPVMIMMLMGEISRGHS